MSWIGIVIVGFCLFWGVIGYRRGFTNMIISAVSLVVIIIAAALLEPVVANMISNHTTLDEAMIGYFQEIVEEKTSQLQIEERTEQIAFIETMQIHKTIRADMIEDNNRVIYEQKNVDSFSAYVAHYLADAVLAGISYLLVFAVASIIVKIATAILIDISEMPVAGFLNRIAGFIFGFGKGTVLVCVMCLVLMLFSYTKTGAYLVEMIKDDPVGNVFYEQNPIVELILRIIEW